ncbi:WcbI family polysaccharide biosynthesis putative acetyltransferase [Branchiibius sp. NY16-3462-2]|uniref:WcbI family polysaccharide biosynthesis putative acetyltransferase n=1 Tax=Branchiibius sp. NY16-3462-2 TaxID=1807500 RepID=UPI000797F69F|nr:WcbI family polysaccharide biosynthesis putative acetyltransferase [Branchiibius sp. NY16-3462-2]KYH43580.1 hypothetical protein AZH51_03750 [Branchiibius sp. NY16-3462-2]
MNAPDARTQHYGTFYGLTPLPENFAVVHGNCQAEAIRILLDDSVPATVRVPPVHELVDSDMEHLERTYRAAKTLIAQPVADGYRGLPLGTAQVHALLPDGAPLVMFPVLRWSGLHPYHVLARSAQVPDPPVVPYYDVRTIARAAGLPEPGLTLPGIRQVAARSRAELTVRQARSHTVRADDLFEAAGSRATNTINHPGNAVLIGVARRILERLGVPDGVTDPGRELLRSIYAPIEPATLEALALEAEPRTHWVVDGEPVDDDVIAQAHLEWLRDQPEALELATRAAVTWTDQQTEPQ